MKQPHVVIIGGGFGGLNAAQSLRNAPVKITLVDRRNHHLFQPLLYQVATAALNPSDIATPIRSILRKQKNVEVILGSVTSIDTANRIVKLDDGELTYDYLIVATGATHSYFKNPEWEQHAPGLKTIEDALEIRRRVFKAFELAEREADPEKQKAWLTFVVVGGGPTGVELAGALAEISRHALKGDFRRIDPTRARILLVEARDRVLGMYSDDLSAFARTRLEQLGVEVITGAGVTEMSADAIRVGEQSIATRTILWGAGVQASPLAKTLGVPLDRAGRVIVQPDLSVPGHPNVFVIGDLAAVQQADGTLVPGVAPAAMQGGIHAAFNIVCSLAGRPSMPFRYRDKGSLATIGRGAAVAHFGKFKLTGVVAWLLWLTLHVFFLIGFRNRMFVIAHWMWALFTRQRGARLITGGIGVPDAIRS